MLHIIIGIVFLGIAGFFSYGAYTEATITKRNPFANVDEETMFILGFAAIMMFLAALACFGVFQSFQ